MEQKLDFGNPPDVGSKQVVVVNAPSPFYFNYLNSLRRFQGLEIPERVRILAPGFFDVELERLDSRTLMVRPKYGFVVPDGFVGDHARTAPPFGRVYAYQGLARSHGTTPFHVGQTMDLPGLTVRVEEVDGHGMATAARMEFSKPLNDPGVLWLRWDWPAERYVSLQPPPVGERTVVGGFFDRDPRRPLDGASDRFRSRFRAGEPGDQAYARTAAGASDTSGTIMAS